ncbi:phosphoenolpyruvate carboxykinase (GTP) [Ihubacter sp. mB4P-1]|uniref:phosphoenolpyruvate carboxykinase (GTP) n=1 Tax=Ihubacter sp. mB4P-1 TaxID=3242370 RepID=UPI00137951D8
MTEVKNQLVLDWVKEMAELTKPDEVVWIDGSEEQLEEIKKLSLATGEMIELNQEKLPGCLYYRTNPKDVARDEKRTVICTRRKEDAGPTNNWVEPKEMYDKMGKLFDGAMKGRTMYAIPFSMGVPGTEFAKIGIELTDSIYVVLSMAIMTRVGDVVIEELNQGADFTKCLHSKATINEQEKYIAHFPEDNTIWSINSAYGGNVLLGKKCLALRIGSYLGRQEGWMAEHMLILKIENKEGEAKYVCGAFPSACGKTNLAMLTPPDYFKEKGYKISTIGDDIAWLRIGEDGRLYAVNPENGFFGVAPGTNEKSNPNALRTTHKGTIFTNVARNLDDNTVWWEKLDKNPPENGEDWLGNPWNGKTSEEKGAHPNSRFTAPAENCPTIADEFFTGQGVPISAIIFGGRRAKAEPLVYQAKSWDHGVFIGSAMASETTAAANGQVGVVRHDPMAMLPFCGYNMAEYFQHWIDMGKKMSNPPQIFHVNWFRTDENDEFMWPGFGDNLRVILWMLNRCEGSVGAVETPLGFEPKAEDIDVHGLDISPETLEKLLRVDAEAWKDEIEGIQTFYDKFEWLPKEITNSFDQLKAEISEL